MHPGGLSLSSDCFWVARALNHGSAAGVECRLSPSPRAREARPLTQKETDSRPLVFSKGILLEPISPGSFVLQARNRQWSKHCNLFSSHKEKVTTTLLFILWL